MNKKKLFSYLAGGFDVCLSLHQSFQIPNFFFSGSRGGGCLFFSKVIRSDFLYMDRVRALA